MWRKKEWKKEKGRVSHSFFLSLSLYFSFLIDNYKQLYTSKGTSFLHGFFSLLYLLISFSSGQKTHIVHFHHHHHHDPKGYNEFCDLPSLIPKLYRNDSKTQIRKYQKEAIESERKEMITITTHKKLLSKIKQCPLKKKLAHRIH